MSVNIKIGNHTGKLRKFPRNNLINKKINKLLVLRFIGYKTRKKKYGNSVSRVALWECKCDCGKICIISQNRLINKNPQVSCGCELEKYRKWAKEYFIPTNTKPTGEAAFNILYINYKTRANKKNIEFLLDRDSFRKLTSLPCFYCGCGPNQSTIKNKKRSINGDYIYNGIDRMDNSIGYKIGNVVPCCGICNKAKRDLPFKEFVSWIKTISQYASQINFNYEPIS